VVQRRVSREGVERVSLGEGVSMVGLEGGEGGGGREMGGSTGLDARCGR